MQKIIDRAESRGRSETDWLMSYHTFSFNQYWNPERMGFGVLRVLNDDTVIPSEGFGFHPHSNMEIVSIPLSGSLTHGDSEGHSKTIHWGEIQTMTAGTGIMHSEMNNSPTEELKFLQIWVKPRESGLKPDYHDFDVKDLLKRNNFNLIVSPGNEVPATLNQEAWFSIGDFDQGASVEYSLHNESNGVYFFVLSGKIRVAEEVLKGRDGMGISGYEPLSVGFLEESRVLAIEVAMK